MRIKDIMSHPAVTCPVDSTADAPARLMWEFDCGVIPLVDAGGRLAGIVTDRDLCMASLTQAKPLQEIQTSSAMARDVASCAPEESIEAAEATMRASQVRRIPVVDGEQRPIGVLSMNDLARQAARGKKNGLDREFVHTLAVVSEPREHDLHPQPAQSLRASA
jgi:CBS domain-containing protein